MVGLVANNRPIFFLPQNGEHFTFKAFQAISSPLQAPSNVLVILLNENTVPVSSWLFKRAYPVKWTTSDLDANANAVVIDTMELAYVRFQSVRI
ncbi:MULTISPECIES: phage tail protein [unclassified Moorena]|uniref:phage tail protein n=1 Tax=unclassified Moorena TaxID=2683338 RepID=UPI0025E1942F|nr:MULTISPECIES: phage tail protein [unclassified Moorena]